MPIPEDGSERRTIVRESGSKGQSQPRSLSVYARSSSLIAFGYVCHGDEHAAQISFSPFSLSRVSTILCILPRLLRRCLFPMMWLALRNLQGR